MSDSPKAHLTAAVYAPQVDVTGVPVTAVKCVPTAVGTAVATFTLPAGATAGRYAATVQMGDGTGALPGVWLADDGAGTVTVYAPPHAFNTPGTYAARVVVRDTGSNREAGGEVVGTGTARVTVSDPGGANVAGLGSSPVAVTEAAGVAERVASFPLPGGAAAGDYTAVVDWGDGSPPVVVAGTAAGGLVEFRAAPGAAEPGVFGVKVSVYHGAAGAGTLVGVVGTTLAVADAAVEVDEATAPAEIERSAGDGADEFLVAAFLSGDETDAAARYRAWVTWGDGTESAGTVYGSGGRFWVGGSHRYTDAGEYRATVRIQDVSGAGTPWGTDVAVRVVDMAQGGDFEASVGVARVDPAAAASGLAGTVSWNDPLDLEDPARVARFGSSGYAEVFAESSPGAPGYGEPGAFAPGVVVTAGPGSDGDTWTVRAGDAALGVAPLSPAAALAFEVGAGGAARALLRFVDPATSDAGYEAVVDWGDGTVGLAAVTPLGGGAFEVVAPGHAYAAAGDYAVGVLVRSLEVGPDRAATLLAGRVARVADPGAFAAGQRRDERDDATWVPAGPMGEVSVNTGAVRLWHALDLDRSPGTGVGRDPHLVYNSATADPRPVIEATVPLVAAPGWTAVVTLTWDGVAQAPQTLTVPEDYSGAWVVAARPDAPATEGLHSWTLSVEAYAPDQVPGADEPTDGWSASGRAQVVNNTSSQFGAGWNLDLDWRVVPDADGAGGALLVYGSGESRYFASQGFLFAAPPEEFGTLQRTCDGFAYTSEFGEVWAFDALGRLLSITDSNGLVTGFDRDPGTGLLAAVTTVDGNVVAVTTGPGAVTFGESGGRTVTVAVGSGPVASITDAGGVRAFVHDGTRITGEAWGTRVTGYGYDAEGLVRSFTLGTDAYAVAPAAAWGLGGIDPNASAVRAPGTGAVTDPRTNATTVTLSLLGRSGVTVFADTTSATAERDAAGQVTALTDERGFTVRSAYDARGHLTRVARPDGGGASFAYDPAFGRVLAAADSYGRTTRYTYDAAGNLLTVTDPLHFTTTYTYLSGPFAGLVGTVTDARNHTTTYEYGIGRRVWRVTDAALGFTRYTYDAAGNVETVTDPLDRVTATTYDGLNRLTNRTDVRGGESRWLYNEVGQVLVWVAPGEVRTKFVYDARGLTDRMIEGLLTPLERITEYDYDAAGNLTDAYAPRGHAASGGLDLGPDADPVAAHTVTAYDARNRPTAVTEGAGTSLARTTRMAYDAAGNLALVTYRQEYDAATGGHVLVDAYQYDAVGRATAVTVGAEWADAGGGTWFETGPGRATTSTYDLNGNVVRVGFADGTATVTAYDALDRATAVTEAVGSAARRTSLTSYDAVGNVAATADALGTVTVFGYDALDRLVSTTEALGTGVQRTWLAAYDAVGRVVREYEPLVYGAAVYAGEGTAAVTHVGTHYTYDDTALTVTRVEGANLALNLLTGVAPAGRELFTGPAPTTVTLYDAAGRVAGVTETVDAKTTRSTWYQYDALGRTKGVYENPVGAAGSETYLRSTVWTYDDADNVRTETRAGYASNTAVYPAARSVTDAYGYDVHDRKTAVRLAAASAPTALAPPQRPETRYTFDARDNVTQVVDPRGAVTQVTYTQFDEPEVVREGGVPLGAGLAAGFLRTTRNTYDAMGRLDTVVADRFASGTNEDGNGATVATRFGYDGLGRRTSVTEAAGSVLQRTTVSVYDAGDRLVRVVDPLARVTATAYDPLGRVTAVTENAGAPALSRTTAFGYDAGDHLVWGAAARVYGYAPAAPSAAAAAALPAGLVTVTVNTFDALGRKVSSTAAANAPAAALGHRPPETRWTYDALGRVVVEQSPVAVTPEGAPSGATASATRHAVRYEYDLFDRVTKATEGATPVGSADPAGEFQGIRFTSFGYDGAGNRTETKSNQVAPGYTGLQEMWGQTTAEYDALGRVSKTYDLIDTKDKAFNGRSLVTWYQYDANGNVLEVYTDDSSDVAARRVTRYDYDRLDRTTAVTAAWDENQDAVKANLGHGSPVTRFEYDAGDRVVQVTDPRLARTTTRYDVLGRRTDEEAGRTVPFGGTQYGPGLLRQHWDYDAGDRVTAATVYDLWVPTDGPAAGLQKRAVVTKYDYDAFDRVEVRADGYGSPHERHTVSTYDPQGHVLTVTTGASPHATVRTVDGQVLPYAAPVTTRYQYDPLGRLREVDPGSDLLAPVFAGLGFTAPWTKVAYDGMGNQRVVSTNVAASAAGTAVTETRFLYDDLYRVREVHEGVAPDGNRTQARVTATKYDSAGNVIERTQLGDPTVRAEYDRAGNLTAQQSDGVALRSNYGYNVFGQVTTTWATDPGTGERVRAELSSATEYDLLGRAKTRELKITYDKTEAGTVRRVGQTIGYRYDANGNVLGTSDTVLPLWYDGTTVQGPDPGTKRTSTTKAEYDALNRRTTDYDPYGAWTRYDYDPLGRVQTVLYRDGKAVRYGYDEVGRRTREYWQSGPYFGNSPGGTVVATEYDAADRVLDTVQGTVDLAPTSYGAHYGTFVYPTSATKASGGTRVRFTYDALGRVRTESPGSVPGLVLTYGYDAAGRRVRVSDSQGGGQTTEYDRAGRMTAASVYAPDGKGAYFTFDYRGDGSYRDDRLDAVTGRAGPAAAAPAVVAGKFVYDAGGRETERWWKHPGLEKYREVVTTGYVTSGGSVGLVAQDTRTGYPTDSMFLWPIATTKYTYDAYGQVSGQEASVNEEPWTPVPTTRRDAAGNAPYQNQSTAATGGGYRTTSHPIEGYAVTYDGGESGAVGSEGNVTAVVHVTDPGPPQARDEWSYAYDARKRLVSVVRQPVVGEVPVTGGSYAVRYEYDALDRLAQRNVTDPGNPDASVRDVQQFVYTGGDVYATAIDGKVTRRYLYGPSGEPLATVTGLGLEFSLTDRQGSTLQTTNDSGDTLLRVAYAGLSESKTVLRPGVYEVGFGGRFSLGGGRRDANTGLVLLNGSWFNPDLGRSMTEGGRGMGLNPYPVAGNSAPNADYTPWYALAGAGLVHAAAEMVGMARDVGNAAVTLGANVLNLGVEAWNRSAPGSLHSPYFVYLPDLHAGSNQAYENAVRRGDLAAAGGIQLQAMAGVITFGAFDPVVAGVKWARGDGTRDEFWGAVGGFGFGLATMGAGRLLARGGAPAAASRGGLTLRQAAGSVAAELGGIGFDLAVPFVRQGFQATGLGLGLAGRAAFRTGNLGDQSNRLSRAVHAGDGTHHTGAAAWAARQVAEWTGTRVCFRAGTPIVAEFGSKAVEQFRSFEEHGDACDKVVSRSEHEPDGVLTVRRVLRRFERWGRVLELQVCGQVIGTTHEHPFFVRSKGWTPAGEVKPGDELGMMAPGWVRVDAVTDTGSWERVYNLEVEDDHTYFVGCDEWGFSVWAHNQGGNCGLPARIKADDVAQRIVEITGGRGPIPWATLSTEFNYAFQTSGRQSSSLRALAKTHGYTGHGGNVRGPRTNAMPVEVQVQNRARAAITDVLEGPAFQTEIAVKAGGTRRLPDGTLQNLAEQRIPGSGPGVRTPDHTLSGQLTPELAARLTTSLGDAVRAELGAGSRVGKVRVYGDTMAAPAEFAINVGPVKSNGTPTLKEMRQIMSYRAKGISVIHVAYGVGS